MAVTKIWDVKGNLSAPLTYVKNPEKTKNQGEDKTQFQALEDVMNYAENEEKTEKKYFVSGINCSPDYARKEFITVKKQFDKEGGIVCYHAYQSFAEGETTPVEAHAIGKELAKCLWGDGFQVVVATHLNTSCLHNHFIINSISFRDGKRYHDCKETYARMREESDRICKEHGLSVIENPKRERHSRYAAQSSKEGIPTRFNMVREAIDEAIRCSCTMREFDHNLKKLGYTTQFNPRRKYWTVTPLGWSKPIRLARLGENYTNEKILERVRRNPISVHYGQKMEKAMSQGTRQYSLPTRKSKIKKHKGLKGLYLRYCYELGYLPKYKVKSYKVHPLIKEDLIKADKISKEVRLLSRENIEDIPSLEEFNRNCEWVLVELSVGREELRKKLRRVMPEEEKEKIRTEIRKLTGDIKNLRGEIKLCEDIKENSQKREKTIKEIDKEKAERIR